jgi:hypothetical protein
MKKIGEYTARGICIEEGGFAVPKIIPLFDGTFTTAYRVIDFKIWSSDYGASSSPDVVGKLSKNDDGGVSTSDFMRADDHNQVAWAASAGSGDGGLGFGEGPIIDPDNLIVEDLYVYGRAANADAVINYLVVMEKYEITDWRGALAMARDRAQGDL